MYKSLMLSYGDFLSLSNFIDAQGNGDGKKKWKSREREEEIIGKYRGKTVANDCWLAVVTSLVNVAMETAQSSGHGKHR